MMSVWKTLHFLRRQVSKLFCLPSKQDLLLWGLLLEVRIWFPVGANSFLLEYNPFQKGLDVQEDKQKVTKVVSLVKMVENLLSVHVSSPSKILSERPSSRCLLFRIVSSESALFASTCLSTYRDALANLRFFVCLFFCCFFFVCFFFFFFCLFFFLFFEDILFR